MAEHIAVVRSEVARLDTLRPHPSNPRNGDTDLIRSLLREHGQYRAIVVNQRTGYIVAGNHVAASMMEEGFDTALVDFIDVAPERELAILLADNKASDAGRYDTGQLISLLESIDLAGTGYTQDDVDNLSIQIDKDLAIPFEVFGESVREADARVQQQIERAEQRPSKVQSGVHELVIVFREQEYRELLGYLNRLRATWQLDSISDVVAASIRESAGMHL